MNLAGKELNTEKTKFNPQTHRWAFIKLINTISMSFCSIHFIYLFIISGDPSYEYTVYYFIFVCIESV